MEESQAPMDGRCQAAGARTGDRLFAMEAVVTFGRALAKARGPVRAKSGTRDDRRFEVVAVASSAGGLRTLGFVLGSLPADFRAPIVIVQHLNPRHRSLMPKILARRTTLRVKEASAGDALSIATVYLAPPDQLVHFLRLSADLLFESVAAPFGEHAIGVVLTGTGTDAAMGTRAIRQNGGTVIAQEPATSEFPGMPAAAIRTGCVDSVLPLEDIGGALVEFVSKGAGR